MNDYADRLRKFDYDWETANYIEDLEAKLAKAVEALDESLYFLQPDERDMSKQAGKYRIVKAYEEITGQKYQVDDDKEKNDE